MQTDRVLRNHDLGKFILSKHEVEFFHCFSVYLVPNPRKIKRITNVYRIARLLAPDDCKFRSNLLLWIILCEQWPLRVSWIIQVLFDDLKNGGALHQRIQLQQSYSLDQLFREAVYPEMASIDFNRCTNDAHTRYQRLFELESDSVGFDKLLREQGCVIDISSLGDTKKRHTWKLMTYTINLNPAVQRVVALVKDVQRLSGRKSDHEGCNRLHKDQSSSLDDFQMNTENSFHQMELPPAEAEQTSDPNVNTDPTVERLNVRNHELPSLHNSLPEAERKCMRGNFQPVLNDSKVGVDCIGYENYAQSIASLVIYNLQVPVVFGMYLTWGTGKSFILQKIKIAIQVMQIEHFIRKFVVSDDGRLKLKNVRHIEYGGEKYRVADDGTLTNPRGILNLHDVLQGMVQRLKKDENQVELMIKWRQRQAIQATRLPEVAFDAQGSGRLRKDYVDDLNAPSGSQILCMMFSPFIRAYRFLSSCSIRGKRYPLPSNDRLLVHLMHAACSDHAEPRSVGGKVAPSQVTSSEDMEGMSWSNHDIYHDYHFVEWNAWLHNGCQDLWASLVDVLTKEIRSRFGPAYASAECDAITVKAIFFLIGCLFCIWIAILLFSPVLEESEMNLSSYQQVLQIYAGIVSAVSSVVLGVNAVHNWIFMKPESDKMTTVESAKKNLDKIVKLLEDPGAAVPTVFDFLVPKVVGGWLTPLLNALFCLKPCSKHLNPCRVVIFIDDLDKCEPHQSTQLLNSLVHLTENAPFVVFLATDPHILVASIEKHSNNLLPQAGISGYEYLDKIVQIPFAIPPMTEQECSKLCEGYLSPLRTC